MKEKNKKTISIKVKLIATICPLVAVILIALILTSYSVSKNIIEQQAEDMLKSSVKNQATQIEAWMSENLAVFESVKIIIEGTNPSSAGTWHILDQYYGYNSNFPEGLYIADQEGNVVQASQIEAKKEDVMNASWYKEGYTRVNMAFGTAYVNEKGESVISATGMMKEGGSKVRILAADVPIERISVIVNSYIDMDDAEAFLLDRKDGTILAYKDDSLISTKLTTDIEAPYLRKVAEKISNYDFDMCVLDNNITAFQEISNTDWLLVSYVPEDKIFQELHAMRNILLAVGIGALIILLVLIERLIYVVINPVKFLTNTIVSMSDGDFTVEVTKKSRDEIGVMGSKVTEFIQAMRQLISNILQASRKLAGQAESSENVSSNLYDASVVQSKMMSELGTTVDQLSESINEIAQNATTLAMVVSDTRQDSLKANDKMNETVQVTEQGRSDMEKVGNAMSDIRKSIDELQDSINNVGNASQEITSIIAIIGEIAEETNLLSLNASIEAARAGDAGKGFAVVATEIAKLASTCADSVQNIDNLITQVNTLIDDTVKKAENSADHIEDSGKLIFKAVDTFRLIYENISQTSQDITGVIEKIGKVDEVATGVAAISEEQAASADEILATAQNMVEEAEQITKNSQLVAEEAKQLSVTSEELNAQMKAFKI